ncbi:MAG TPA: ATP-binding protein [Longimicrobiales bacterium]
MPRALTGPLNATLATLPVAVVTGARQTGKSTLVSKLLGDDRLYLTLDDYDVLAQAADAPDQLVRRAPRLTLDEVQRSPDLLLAVKRAVDQDRRAGRFLLTGSANLLLMRNVSESLAGRAVYLTLWPLTRREQLGLGTTGRWSVFLSTPPPDWPDILSDDDAPPEDWRALALRGGYPTPSLELSDAEARSAWFGGYVRTYLERDLQELSAVANLVDFRRLMSAASLRIGRLLNQSELGRDVGLPQPTVHRHLNLLETTYQLVRLPAYAVNRTKRLMKSPKLYWADTGLALHLAGVTEPGGMHLENIVAHDLVAWRDTRLAPPAILYWRTTTGEEVDFVIEAGGRLLPIEVKAADRVRPADAWHLQSFRAEYPDRSLPGVLLYTGEETYWLTDDVLAVPWWRVV